MRSVQYNVGLSDGAIIVIILLSALYFYVSNTPTPDTCVLTRNGSVVCGELAP
jgi:hypothetical protein